MSLEHMCALCEESGCRILAPDSALAFPDAAEMAMPVLLLRLSREVFIEATFPAGPGTILKKAQQLHELPIRCGCLL